MQNNMKIAFVYLIYISMDFIIALLRCGFLAMLSLVCNLVVSGTQSFVIISNSHRGYICMCIVSSIGWNIYTPTGTKSVSKSMPLTGILRFKMLNFHGI